MNTGRICLALTTAFVVMCSTSSAQRRRAYDPFNDAAAGLMGDVIADVQGVAQGLMELQAYSADLSRRIDQARKAFWAQYPNGPQLAAREAEFNQRLTDKDLLIVGMFLNSSDGCAQGVSGWGLLTGISGIDGGIPVQTRWSFCRWVRANERYRKAFNAFSAGATVLQRPEYQPYRRARDWGRIPTCRESARSTVERHVQGYRATVVSDRPRVEQTVARQARHRWRTGGPVVSRSP